MNIIFDFWGTLAHMTPGPDFGQAIADLLHIGKAEYQVLVYRHWFARDLTADEFANELVQYAGTTTTIIPELTSWITSPVERARLYPEVIPALSRLSHENKLYLASDNSSNGRKILDRLDLTHHFERAYISSEQGVTKANGLYEVIFADIDANSSLVVGDSFENDYRMAITHGAGALIIDRTQILNARHVVHTLEDVLCA